MVFKLIVLSENGKLLTGEFDNIALGNVNLTKLCKELLANFIKDYPNSFVACIDCCDDEECDGYTIYTSENKWRYAVIDENSGEIVQII